MTWDGFAWSPSARAVIHPVHGPVIAVRFPQGTELAEEAFKLIIPEGDRFRDTHPDIWFVRSKLWALVSQAFDESGDYDVAWPDPSLLEDLPDADLPPIDGFHDFHDEADQQYEEQPRPQESPRPAADDPNGDYAYMGLAPEADMSVVKAAYRVLCMKWHPDKGGSPEKMTRLNEAYTRIQARRAKKGGP